MPTIFTHAVATAAIGTVVLPAKTPVRIWTLGVLCAMVPDLDVISFPLGISHSDMLGHRGVTHSIAFALGLSLLASVLALRDSAFDCPRWRIWLFVFLAVGSHGPLDALTDGGNGIALFAPFSAERYFFPVTPIAVSPIGLRFVSERGLHVMASEFVWVWIPSLAVAAIGLSLRRRRVGR